MDAREALEAIADFIATRDRLHAESDFDSPTTDREIDSELNEIASRFAAALGVKSSV